MGWLFRYSPNPVEQARALAIGFDQIGRAEVKKRFSQTKERLHYLMQHHVVSDIASFIKAFEMNFDIKVSEHCVLGHGDFYARHLLLDESKKLTAVIDWGDCELLSPAIDLAIVYQFLPLSTHPIFWRVYGVVDQTTRILAKLRAIYSAVTIAWYAHQVQDKSLLAEGLLSLKFIGEVINADS